MAKHENNLRLTALKLRFDAEGDALLQTAGVTLADLACLLVFGQRRRTAAGLEISFAARLLPPEIAAQLARLDRLAVLLAEGRLRACRWLPADGAVSNPLHQTGESNHVPTASRSRRR